MDPFVGEIRLLPYTFVPTNWLPCDGRILTIQEHMKLFAVIGSQYGGDGSTNFALPNLPGRVAIGAGAGPGLTPRHPGDVGGETTVTLGQPQVPSHTHTLMGSATVGTYNTPADSIAGQPCSSDKPYRTAGTATQMAELPSVGGGGQAHDNVMPSLALQHCIAVMGVYPWRD